MNKEGQKLRIILYKILPFQTYLWVLSKMYFFLYKAGLLKSNSFFEYQHFLNKVIDQGGVCIDIGANLGYYTVPMSKIVGRRGLVYAVEPVKPVLKVLYSNTKHLKNVKILPYALGEENKEIRLGNNTLNQKGYIASGSHFIMENSFKKDAETDIVFNAEMKKGSELFKDLHHLDLIKCDVEGYEVNILPEMKDLIIKTRPTLFIESNGENRSKILEFFNRINFKAFIIRNGLLHGVKDGDKNDLIIIPEEKTERFKEYIKD